MEESMPNGESKNWIRMCAAINGYQARYNEWPKKVRVPKFFSEELERVATQEQLNKLASKIELIADDSEFVAEGDNNESYNYSREGFPDKQPDISAQDWIGFMPDYYD